MKNENIKRNGSIELRTITDGSVSRTVYGYAVVFDSPSQDMGFIETIKRGAITQETIEQCDVFAKFNHEDDKILAKSLGVSEGFSAAFKIIASIKSLS